MNWNTFNRDSLTNQIGVYGQPLQYAPERVNQGFGLGQDFGLDPNQFDDVLNTPASNNGSWFSRLFSGGNGDSTLTGQLGKFGAGAQLGLGAIGTVGGLMGANRMYGLAKDQFRHARDVTNTNLTNQIQAYNTALSDRARNRAAMEGRDVESANKYIEENKLRR